MMEFEQKVRKTKCCSCGKPMKESKHINMIQLKYVATWQYPYATNVLASGETHNFACSIICDGCVEDKSTIRFAVEFDNDKIVYHPLEELKEVKEKFNPIYN